MSQGKLDMVKQEKARVNIGILGIRWEWEKQKYQKCRNIEKQKNRWEWVNLTQMTIIYTTVGKNTLEEMK